jgi:hypothetical protein
MLLFLINGIFRGAGDANIAMRSLWIANIANIILCPLLINGLGPIPPLGLKGAAIATTIGRGLGVLYQLYRLFIRKGLLHFDAAQLKPHKQLLLQIAKIGGNGTLQFLVGSASWIFLARRLPDCHTPVYIFPFAGLGLKQCRCNPNWSKPGCGQTRTRRRKHMDNSEIHYLFYACCNAVLLFGR